MPVDQGTAPATPQPDYASLLATLLGGGANTLGDAQSAQDQQALTQQVQAANAAASQAGQQYQGAAAQPPPQANPADTLVPTLMSGIASVISQNPSYQKNRHEEITQQHKDLMDSRVQNLQALKDSYDMKARAAEKMGDLKMAGEMRLKQEQLSKTLAMLLQKMKDDAAMERVNTRGDIGEDIVKLRAALGLGKGQSLAAQTDPEDYIDIHKSSTGEDIPYITVSPSKVPDRKVQQALVSYARKNKLAILGDTEDRARQLIESVRGDMGDVTANLVPKLPSKAGYMGTERMVKGAANRFKQLAQTDEYLGAYPATRTGAIKLIQALASLGKGLRINQAEIAAAQNFDYPRVDDTQDVARSKFKILGEMLDHMEGAIYGRPPSDEDVRRVLGEIRQLKAMQSGKAPAAAPTAPAPKSNGKAGDPMGIRS